jgi:hypothetical protein
MCNSNGKSYFRTGFRFGSLSLWIDNFIQDREIQVQEIMEITSNVCSEIHTNLSALDYIGESKEPLDPEQKMKMDQLLEESEDLVSNWVYPGRNEIKQPTIEQMYNLNSRLRQLSANLHLRVSRH